MVRRGNLDGGDDCPRFRRFEFASPNLRTYIRDELTELRAELYFDYAVDGATAAYGPVGSERAGVVRARLDDLLS